MLESLFIIFQWNSVAVIYVIALQIEFVLIGRVGGFMKILFTICGRAGSKGIKNKNIKPFLGIPLCVYTLSAVDLYLKSQRNVEADVAVNTDCKELINIMKANPWLSVHPIVRCPELSGENISKISVIRNCYEIMQSKLGTDYDMVVDLDITSPLRRLSDIEHLVDKMSQTKSDVVFSVVDARRNPYFNMVQECEQGYERVIRSELVTRQSAPQVYDMNASLYAYNPKFLKKEMGIFEGKCEIIKMFDTAVLDLDYKDDFELMQVIAEYLYRKDSEFGEIYVHCTKDWRWGKE